MQEDVTSIVNSIYSRFREEGAWPRARELQAFFAERGSFRTWVAREASDRIVCPEGSDARVSLTFIAMAEAGAAADDMAVAWKVLRHAGELAAEDGSPITEKLVASRFGVHGSQLARIGHILAAENFVFSAGGQSAGDMSSYSYLPSERALQFRQVESLSQYVTAKAAVTADERERGALQARSYQQRLAAAAPSLERAPGVETPPAEAMRSYVSLERIAQLRALPKGNLDASRLVRMCEELNAVSAAKAYFATVMLVRSILDHVPPVFDCKTFAQVTGSVGGRSFKELMANLDASARKIADGHLHAQMRRREALPTDTQVDFSQSLDVLLAEVCVHWRSE